MQPILKSNTDYGEILASSYNTQSGGALPWRAVDGIKDGSATSWESARDAYPAWWCWHFPSTLKISKLTLYNKYSSYNYVTKSVSVYSDSARTNKIASGTFTDVSFSVLEFVFAEPIVTDCLTIVCEDSYKDSGTYVGLGEVEITAQQGIEQFTVNFYDYDGSILKYVSVDKGESVEPPESPVRKGYTFIGWDKQTSRITEDTEVFAVYEKIPTKSVFLLTVLNEILQGLNIPVETGAFQGAPPDRYVVLTPLTDNYEIFADNRPNAETQEVRISLYDKGNYLKTKNTISRLLLESDITITERRYIGREDNTGYFHYAIDVAKNYNLED